MVDLTISEDLAPVVERVLSRELASAVEQVTAVGLYVFTYKLIEVLDISESSFTN